MFGKFFVMSLVLGISSSALASNRQDCKFEVEVTESKNLARLDGVATFRPQSEDYEQIVTVKVTRKKLPCDMTHIR